MSKQQIIISSKTVLLKALGLLARLLGYNFKLTRQVGGKEFLLSIVFFGDKPNSSNKENLPRCYMLATEAYTTNGEHVPEIAEITEQTEVDKVSTFISIILSPI